MEGFDYVPHFRGVDVCSSGNGAGYRMMREWLGWTQREVAETMPMDLRTLKRAESPARPDVLVSERMWRWMEGQWERHQAEVSRILDACDALDADHVTLCVYHDNDNAPRPDLASPGGMLPAGALNSIVRDAAQFLQDDGVSVDFGWSGQAGPDAIR